MIGSLETCMDKRIKQLMLKFGYKLAGDTLIQLGVRGHTSDYIFTTQKFSSYFGASHYLIPIIKDDEYYNELKTICPY